MPHRRAWRGLLRIAFITGDTGSVRILLGTASLGWTILLWMPLHTFERAQFSWMGTLGPEWLWGALFLIHFLGIFWRVVDPVVRRNWDMGINVLGFTLWSASTSAQLLAQGYIDPSDCLEFVSTCALFVVMIRTGLGNETSKLL